MNGTTKIRCALCLLCVTMLSLALIGCDRKAQSMREVERIAPPAASVKLVEKLDDAVITAEVKARLAEDPELQGLTLEVSTTEGVVHLRGSVNSMTQSARAEEVARQVAGVKDVVNHLTLNIALR